jgi:transcription initiation factor TFIID subunit 15
MPVAQRGAQDDCRYFSVGQGGGNAGSATGSNTNVVNGGSTTITDSSAATTSPVAKTKNRGRKNRKGA